MQRCTSASEICSRALNAANWQAGAIALAACSRAQLDELEGWLDRQKDHDAGDWPTGEFTGGKHDRHDSADDLKA